MKARKKKEKGKNVVSLRSLFCLLIHFFLNFFSFFSPRFTPPGDGSREGTSMGIGQSTHQVVTQVGTVVCLFPNENSCPDPAAKGDEDDDEGAMLKQEAGKQMAIRSGRRGEGRSERRVNKVYR